MSKYRWVPDLVCHGVCPRDGNLHALEVSGDRIVVFTAATRPHCRAEAAEARVKELEAELRELKTRNRRYHDVDEYYLREEER